MAELLIITSMMDLENKTLPRQQQSALILCRLIESITDGGCLFK